jgi:hypothetical protein
MNTSSNALSFNIPFSSNLRGWLVCLPMLGTVLAAASVVHAGLNLLRGF